MFSRIVDLKTNSITDNPLDQEEIDEIERSSYLAKIDFVRNTRNSKLTESDWTQVADAPVDKAAWATYRQALRDIPEQAGFPNEVTWPTEPEV